MGEVIKFKSFSDKPVNESTDNKIPKIIDFGINDYIEFRIPLPYEVCYDKYGKTDQLVYSNMMEDQKNALAEYLNPIIAIFINNGLTDLYESSSEYYEDNMSYCFVDYKVFIDGLEDMRKYSKSIEEINNLK